MELKNFFENKEKRMDWRNLKVDSRPKSKFMSWSQLSWAQPNDQVLEHCVKQNRKM